MIAGSAVYEGWVRHRRYTPTPHEFRYRICQPLVDLSELVEVCAQHPLWSASRPAIARFRREDHFGDPSKTLDTAVRDRIESETRARPKGAIRLLTHFRYFGYVMNPVSFYFVQNNQESGVGTIVAEIHNTPWGERHCYVLPRENSLSPRLHHHRFAKAFHVSPFMGMDQEYEWKLSDPDKRLVVHMQNRESGRLVFDATMVLRRRPITRATMTRILARYPLMTTQVVAAIYWQAFRLWLKKTPFHSHPSKALNDTTPQ